MAEPASHPAGLVARGGIEALPTINEHLKILYADGKLQSEATIRKFLMVHKERFRQINRYLDHYNLDAILAGAVRLSELNPNALSRMPHP
jgi:hypothetical protein